MDEHDLIGDTEHLRAQFRLLGEQLARVDAGTDDPVIACPGAKHLPRPAAEVEHSGSRLQAQHIAESGELLGCERIVDAVSALADVDDPRNIQCRASPRGCEPNPSLPDPEPSGPPRLRRASEALRAGRPASVRLAREPCDAIVANVSCV
jgi:hypothetical protein